MCREKSWKGKKRERLIDGLEGEEKKTRKADRCEREKNHMEGGTD